MILSNVERLLSLYLSNLDCLDFPAFSSPKTKKTTEIFGVITTQLKNPRARVLEEITTIISKLWQTQFPVVSLFSGVVYE